MASGPVASGTLVSDPSISAPVQRTGSEIAIAILISASVCHLLNDMMQSMLASIYPMIKGDFHLDFAQIGIITLTFQLTASLLQPFVGMWTDRHPMPFSLPIGMGSTLMGLVLLAFAGGFATVLVAAALIGVGSSVFHPEASRVSRLASGGRHGLAQSLFQVGGNFGTAIGPLLAAFIIVPYGRQNVLWFTLAAFLGIAILTYMGSWYNRHLIAHRSKHGSGKGTASPVARNVVIMSMTILIILTFTKNFYMASFHSYYTFYLIDRFDLSVQSAQIHLFLFLGAVAAGTILGGPIGDAIGRKFVIWFSILGVVPFTLALPYVNLFWTDVFAILTGLIMASAFPAIVVYAQELLPGKVGMVAGLFFGFAFGMGGLGAALLGWLADHTSIGFVYQVCSFLPLLGILTWFLPNLETARMRLRAGLAKT
ncbi:MAG TPA: MFS transporter [Geminicoccus sp.]|jgi:FSR family fosmidomycin resistance protein-like MFS transporter|uniref:MFS transporter n=1 Tax=Geminicoccus sp. TaxID=2024832 RepID=UPI002E367038|nr:MFS transporter [Geminicoccus sp.]HEX2527736.1 MFS transporter [Geminicoccus sp.]